MKVKYKFDHIDSEADSLSLKAYGVEIANFKKADFGKNWVDLLDKKFELNPYLVGDLDKLSITGNETNNIICKNTQAKKDLWKEYANNKVDFSVFNKRIKEFKDGDTLKLSFLKYNNSINGSDAIRAFDALKITLPKNFYYDFSKLAFTDRSYFDFEQGFNYIKENITKLPNYIDISNTQAINLNGYKKLQEINLTTFNIHKDGITSFRITNNEAIEQLPDDIKFYGGYGVEYNFKNCKKLKKIPQLPMTYDLVQTFYGCENLKEIEELKCHYTSRFNETFSTGNNLHIKKLILGFKSNISYKSTSVNEDTRSLKFFNTGDGTLTIDYLQIPYYIPFYLEENTPNSINIGVVTQKYQSDFNGDYPTVKDFKKFKTPVNIKAFPFNLLGYNDNSLPETTLDDDNRIVWCDYIKTPNKNFKNIINSLETDKEIIVNTLKTREDNLNISVPLQLTLNQEYPYSFTFETISARNTEVINYESDTYSSKPVVTFKGINDNNVLLNLNFSYVKNISDNRTVTVLLNGNINYTAAIEGFEFYGSIPYSVKVKIIFNLNEGASMSFDFEDDDGNPLNLPLEPNTENTEPNTEQTEQEPNE